MDKKLYVILALDEQVSKRGSANVHGIYKTEQDALAELKNFVAYADKLSKERGEKEYELDPLYKDEKHYVRYDNYKRESIWVDVVDAPSQVFWSREYDLLRERERIANVCWTAKTLGELVETGVNAVRVFDAEDNYVGYAYKSESGDVVVEQDERVVDVKLTDKTRVKNTEIDRDDDDYTILITCLDEDKKNA